MPSLVSATSRSALAGMCGGGREPEMSSQQCRGCWVAVVWRVVGATRWWAGAGDSRGCRRGDRAGVPGENEPVKGKLAVGSLDKVVLSRFGIWLL
jgi:hypothetical protein